MSHTPGVCSRLVADAVCSTTTPSPGLDAGAGHEIAKHVRRRGEQPESFHPLLKIMTWDGRRRGMSHTSAVMTEASFFGMATCTDPQLTTCTQSPRSSTAPSPGTPWQIHTRAGDASVTVLWVTGVAGACGSTGGSGVVCARVGCAGGTASCVVAPPPETSAANGSASPLPVVSPWLTPRADASAVGPRSEVKRVAPSVAVSRAGARTGRAALAAPTNWADGGGAGAGMLARGSTNSVQPHNVHGLPAGDGPTPAWSHQAAAQRLQNTNQNPHFGTCGALQCSQRSIFRRSAFNSPRSLSPGRKRSAGGGRSASSHVDGDPRTAYTRGWSVL